MRLHHLTIEAFGPFAGEVAVDFDALAEGGLFLINGPTGSGKTSLLDAVCFALYGAVPGGRRDTKADLRSHHADPTVVPRVVLDLTAGGRRLRIERQPEFQRPKKRGTGTIKAPAKVLLRELVDGAWVDRGDGRHDDVAMIVDDVIGLGLAQFQTVVLLPQGEFSAFLRADTTARADVLTRLFDTRRFGDIQAWLEARRRATSELVEGGQRALVGAVERAADAVAGLDLHPPAPTDESGCAPDDSVPDPLPARVPLADAGGESAAAVTDAQQPSTSAENPSVPQGLTIEADAGGESAPLVDPAVTDPDAVDAMLATATEVVADAVTRAEDAATAAAQQAAAARAELVAARAVEAARARAARASADLSALDAIADEVAAATAALDADRRAGAVHGTLRAAERAQAEAESARHALDALPAPLDDADRARERLAVLAERAADVARLSALAARRDATSTARTARAAAVVDAREAHAAAVHARMQEDAARAEAAAEHDRLAPLAAPADDLARLAAAVESASRAHAATDDARAAAERADDAVRLAAERLGTATRAAAALHAARAAGLAAELAAGLTDGEPCPVCGSPEHPSPAAPADGTPLVAPEDVEAAESALEAARDAHADAQARAAAAASTVAERTDTAERAARAVVDAATATPVDVCPDDVATAAARASLADRVRDALAAARAAGTDLARAQAVVSGAAERLGAADDAVHAADTALAAARAADDAARQEADDATAALIAALAAHAECPCMPDGSRTVPHAAQAASPGAPPASDASTPSATPSSAEVTTTTRRHEDATAAARSAVAAHDAAQAADERAATARRALVDALAEHDLPDAQALRAALLDPGERSRLAALVDDASRRRAAATALLAQDDVVAALAADDPDVPALADAEAATATAERAATDALAVLRRAATALARATDDARRVIGELGPAAREAAVVREVADTVAGTGANNTLRMSLPTYVLAARLEEVVALANERLTTMTSGRYELRHSDDLAGRGRRSGLGLEVVDAWSGTARDTKTLSGGETFMASLALALGLGDAVRAEAGGVDLETLFVDEGFGTLDDEALEQVMEVLDGLRDGGRAVGIVSHVAELRTRIPAQVKLTRTPTGSTLRVVTAPDPS